MVASAAPWRRIVYAWFIALFVLGNMIAVPTPALAVGGTSGNVTGTINDSAGHPIAGVAVSAASGSGSFQTTTNARGQFNLLGVPTDTYTFSFEKTGFQSQVLRGVTVQGDATVNLGAIAITSASQQVIGRVTARSANSAYQPSVTVDSTTLSGARISQALGVATNTNEAQLLRAAPAIDFDTSGGIAIRGSFATEIGYQFDGVPYTAPFFDANGAGGAANSPFSNGYLNGFGAGAGGSVQIVSGSGDATQGNIGAGVVNIIPPRGTYPPGGLLAYTFGSPYRQNQYDLDYGIASKDGRISNYIAFDQNNYVPQYPLGYSAATLGEFAGTSSYKHSDLMDNFVLRFGANKNQSFQVLFRTLDEQQFGNYGGLSGSGSNYYPYNPYGSAFFDTADPFGFGASLPGYLGLAGLDCTQADIAKGCVPGSLNQNQTYLGNAIKSVNGLLPFYDGTVKPGQPEQTSFTPSSLLKLAYTAQLGDSTFFSADYYSFYEQQGTENYAVQGVQPSFSTVGGQRIGFDATISHQFGTAHTVSLATKFENGFPKWYDAQPVVSDEVLALDGLVGQAGAQIGDFSVPTNPNLVSGPGNPCGGIIGTCYVHDYLVSHGLYNGKMPQIPTFGIDYHGTDIQQYGIGIRDQWNVTDKLKLDYGLREDGARYNFGPNVYANDVYGNPSDLGSAQLTNSFLKPNIIQPRFSLSYEIDRNNAISASYGRSVDFAFGQLAGTPMAISNVDPRLGLIPANDTVAAPACGSGFNNGKGYSTNPNIILTNTGAQTAHFFKCQNYASELFWALDQFADAPDYGGSGQPTFSNYDVGLSHQFSRGALAGWGTKLTAYWRRGFNNFEDVLLASGPPDPATGQASGTTFATRPDGIEKTFGLEFMLTTPDRPVGFSGFLSANYLNGYTTIPPASAGGLFSSNTIPPLLSSQLLASGQLFRNGVIPPFELRTGVTYRTRSGFRINPIFSGTTGQPIGVGNQTIAIVNGNLQSITSTNFADGVTGPIGGGIAPLSAFNAANYVDPALPGSYLRPNIAANRGFNEGGLPGEKLSNPTANVDIDFEYDLGPSKRNIIGFYIHDITNNHYGTPYQNTKWQPVATGVGGPQTGQNQTNANPDSSGFANYQAGIRDQFAPGYGYGPMSIQYGSGTTFSFYLQRKL